MKYPLFAAFLQIFILFCLEFFVYQGIVGFLSVSSPFWMVTLPYVLISLLTYYGLTNSVKIWRSNALERGPRNNVLLGLSMSILATKFVLTVLLMAQDALRLFAGLIMSIYQSFYSKGTFAFVIPQRVDLITGIMILTCVFLLLCLIFGVVYGKYRFTVERVVLNFEDLPESFDGMTMVQISDAHSGSWDSIEGVAKGIKMIEQLQPDLIVFTGDLVNQYKDEINPFIPLFSRLKAPLGKFAILGNHDYYGQPRDPHERASYWQDFKQKFVSMGFDLLLNSNRKIEKDGHYLRIVGVENWGNGRWFPKKGDLDIALQGSSTNEFTLLLSHDPTHWEDKVLFHPRVIHLTLSGHTHAMQFGINLGKLKWSPVKYRYKKWMGLYKEKNQFLYVNRGLGFLGFPGRTGMWPEITLFELRKKP